MVAEQRLKVGDGLARHSLHLLDNCGSEIPRQIAYQRVGDRSAPPRCLSHVLRDNGRDEQVGQVAR